MPEDPYDRYADARASGFDAHDADAYAHCGRRLPLRNEEDEEPERDYEKEPKHE